LANILGRALSYKLIDSGFFLPDEVGLVDKPGSETYLETYDDLVAKLVCKSTTANPQRYFASRKYRTGKY
jgi:hypothetical protein